MNRRTHPDGHDAPRQAIARRRGRTPITIPSEGSTTITTAHEATRQGPSEPVPADGRPRPPDPARILLTVAEAAQRLGIGRTTMYTLLSSGQVVSVRVGRLRRVRPADLDAYAAALSAAPVDHPMPAAA